MRPKTKSRDFQDFQDENLVIQQRRSKERLALNDPQILEAQERLRERFKGTVHNDDRHTFNTSSEMRAFLLDHAIQTGVSVDQINEIVEHEEAHAAAARRLGYTSTFGIWTLDAGDGKVGWVPYTDVEEEAMTMEERKQIASAPTHDDLSDMDRRDM